MTADVAIKAVSETATAARSTIVERQLEQRLLGLLDGLAMQIDAFPKAEGGLRALVSPWIHEAEVDLRTFRKTGADTMVDIESEIDRAKRRYWAELVVIGQAYPDLPIHAMHDDMCARVDRVYAKHLRNRAAERQAHDDRMNAIRNAMLE